MTTALAEPTEYASLNTRPDAERTTAWTLTACSAVAALAGGGGAILAILGLAERAPLTLLAGAAVALGGGLFVQGVGGLSRTKRRHHRAGDAIDQLGLMTGIAGELVGGAGGATLGLVALGGARPWLALIAATIVLGAGVLTGALMQRALAWLARPPHARRERLAYTTTTASTGLLALAGGSAIVLGVLPLLVHAPVRPLIGAAMIAVGAAGVVGGAALAARFGLQLATHATPHDPAPRLIELMSTRLEAARSGHALYEATLDKLRASSREGLAPLRTVLELFADKELENCAYLEAQLEGFGADPHVVTPLAALEHRTTAGSEEVVGSADVTDPLHLLLALHTADSADATGWTLFTHVVDEIGHHELKKEITVRASDKRAQVRELSLWIEELVREDQAGLALGARRGVAAHAPAD